MGEELKSLGNMFTIPDELTAPTCVVCHADAEQRCSRCHTEWYCSRKCQVSDWKRHKHICIAICEHNKRAEMEAPMIQEVTASPLRPPLPPWRGRRVFGIVPIFS